jgi:hypothetical protein
MNTVGRSCGVFQAINVIALNNSDGEINPALKILECKGC